MGKQYLVQVRINKFLEKTRKKKGGTGKENEDGKSNTEVKEQEKLRKKVIDLMKKNKLAVVRKMVQNQDDLKPWGLDAQARV